MRLLRRFFLSRTTVLALIVLALGAVTISALVPQAFITDADKIKAWRDAHPYLAPLAARFGLDHIFTTPGFAVVLLMAFFSLGLSCVDQFRSAWQKSNRSVPGTVAGIEIRVSRTVSDTVQLLRKNGYPSVIRGETVRLVRHPWGYWGNALLHLGMVVTIAASLTIALTQQRGMVQLAEEEVYRPGHPWASTEKGLLADDLALAEAVRMEKVGAEFRANYGLKKLASTVSFLSPDGVAESRTVEVNSILHRNGLRIYQGTQFGHAFYVEVAKPDNRHEISQLLMQHPVRPDEASYNDFTDMLGPGLTLRAKYFVDGNKQSFERINPLLVLRLDERGGEVGRLTLKVGSEGNIGPYRFRLLKYNNWSQLIFVRLTGIPCVFFGFFILLLGGVLHYFTPPREIVVEQSVDGCRLTWRAARFNDFYADEPVRLAALLNAENPHG